MKNSKAVVAAIVAALAVSSVPVAALACCEYDAEKDAYVCGGGTKDTATNGGCNSRAPEAVTGSEKTS